MKKEMEALFSKLNNEKIKLTTLMDKKVEVIPGYGSWTENSTWYLN